jgi:hypothetical protein
VARRRELKNIAYGIISSFNSRNNDLLGYWGIGVLCLSAQRLKADFFVLDILNKSATPLEVQAKTAAYKYNKILISALEKRQAPILWISSALLTLTFNPEYQEEFHSFGSALGSRYICSLEITDDFGKKHRAKSGGICWAHNAERESRSGRACSP